MLDDGTVFTAGGTGLPSCDTPSRGAETTWTFDPASSDTCGQRAPTVNYCGEEVDRGWRRRTTGDSAYERWYPTCTVLATGKVLVTSGATCSNVTAEVPEIYDRFASSSAFAAMGSNSASTRYGGPWYPFMFGLRSGKVYHVGPHAATDTVPASMQTLAPTAGSYWQNFGTSGVRGGSAVLYTTRDPSNGKTEIVKTGGFLSGTGGGSGGLVSSIEIVRDDGSNTVSSASMAVARLNHNLTVLPNGEVLITGGGNNVQNLVSSAVYVTEMWDPANPNTTPARLADAPSPSNGTRARTYHSTALLLPDGRVLSAGGEACTSFDEFGRCVGRVNSETGDFFNPPYLYKTSDNSRISDTTDRPQVSGAPSLVATGSQFAVTVTAGSGSTIDRACLIRPGAVTHAFNQEQRYIPLSFTSSGSSRTVTAPASAEEAPPGYYLLFFSNDLTYPSIGQFVRVWGIVQNSLAATVTLSPDSLTVVIEWDTSIGATGGDQVVFYDQASGGNVVTPVWVGADQLSDHNRHHKKMYKFAPCVLTYIYYEVKSTQSSTTSQSHRTTSTRFKASNCLES